MPVRMPRAAGEAHSRPRRSRLLLVGLPVFAVFAAFGIIVWLAYQENARVPEGEPPLIKASTEPFKLTPDDPGGREVADQGEINQLLRDEPAPAPPERVLPLPEEPRAPVVHAALPEEAATELDAAPAAQATATATNPASSADSAEASAQPAESEGALPEAEAALARLLANVEQADSSATTPAPETQAAAPREPAAGSASAPAPPERPRTTVAPTTVLPAAAPPAATRAAGPSAEADEALDRLMAEVAGLPAAPAPQASGTASEPSRAVAAIAPAQPAASEPAAGSAFRIQLAAVRDERDARRAWANLVDDLGPLLADHRPFYERAETSNGVFYRIQVGPFANQRAADAMCVEVQRHKTGCFVVAP